jgi:hypothetical protein
MSSATTPAQTPSRSWPASCTGRRCHPARPGSALAFRCSTFRPSRWDRWSQQLEVTVGELLPDQPVPLLKQRPELSREEALKLWAERGQQGWQATTAQGLPPQRTAPG